MDEGGPTDITALRRKAIEAQSGLAALADLYVLAVRAAKDPGAVTPDEVRTLAEGILRHVKPHIGKR